MFLVRQDSQTGVCRIGDEYLLVACHVADYALLFFLCSLLLATMV